MEDCIFCKFANKEIPKEFIYEDEDFMVFPDIHPIKPVHLLVIPKKHIADFLELEPAMADKMTRIIQQMVKEHHLSDNGYRLVVNGGGAQEVHHLHLHITGPWGKAAAL